MSALYTSLSSMHGSFWLSLLLLAVAIYLLKGCPMCWTLGLIETIAMKIHERNERKFDVGKSSRLSSFGNTTDAERYEPIGIQTTIPASGITF